MVVCAALRLPPLFFFLRAFFFFFLLRFALDWSRDTLETRANRAFRPESAAMLREREGGNNAIEAAKSKEALP